MYRRILVAVENSAADRTILDHVAGLAKVTGAELVLVHVADGWAARNFDQLKLRESEEMKSDRAYLDGLRAEYPEMLFAGRLAPQDIGALADRARMLVMPSRHSEPFGLTAVEALWSGLPVLASARTIVP